LRTRSVDFAAARRSAQSADGGALIVKCVSADAQRVPIEDAIDLVHGADGGGGNGRILDQRRTWDQGAWKWPLRRLLVDHVDQASGVQPFLGPQVVRRGKRDIDHG